jgi:hypothetical protein
MSDKITRRVAFLAIANTAAALAGEKQEARALFDGRSFRNFRTPTGTTPPSVSWRIVNGAIESIPDAPRECDLWTVETYDNFDLKFDWRVGKGGNSGIKYLIQANPTDHVKEGNSEFVHENSLGFEFQLVDSASHESTDGSKHASGALYNYLPPTELPAHRTGEWNSGRLLVNYKHVEHWINGKRVLAYSLDSPELKAALAANRANSARLLERLARRKTPIVFQHHHSPVAFRSIRITA